MPILFSVDSYISTVAKVKAVVSRKLYQHCCQLIAISALWPMSRQLSVGSYISTVAKAKAAVT